MTSAKVDQNLRCVQKCKQSLGNVLDPADFETQSESDMIEHLRTQRVQLLAVREHNMTVRWRTIAVEELVHRRTSGAAKGVQQPRVEWCNIHSESPRSTTQIRPVEPSCERHLLTTVTLTTLIPLSYNEVPSIMTQSATSAMMKLQNLVHQSEATFQADLLPSGAGAESMKWSDTSPPAQ